MPPTELAVEVLSGPVEVPTSAGGERFVQRGVVHAPADPSRLLDPPVMAVCLPGGHLTYEYFDLTVHGYPDADYSMAAHLAGRGIIVVALDHPGVGHSDPADDVCTLTPQRVAAADHDACRHLVERLADGNLLDGLGRVGGAATVGVGHSMGAMITVIQQARHRTHDAVVLLGHGDQGLPAYLTADELAAAADLTTLPDRIVDLARRRRELGAEGTTSRDPAERRAMFHADDVPQDVADAVTAASTELLYACGLTAMIPGSTLAEKAVIDVPVFLGYGELDLNRQFHASVQPFARSNDVTLYVVPGASHCHNQASGRVALWDRLAGWIGGIRPHHPGGVRESAR